jgi:hypothetical protein
VHPDRSAPPPRPSLGSQPAFLTWLTIVGGGSILGAVLTVVAAPASSGGDMFDSPMLPITLAALTVLCGLAGGFVPDWRTYWGLLPVVPYFAAFFIQTAQPSVGASLAPVGFVLLLVGLVVPWSVGFAVGVSRRAGRR